MRCPRCGVEVPEHQKFCAECGEPLHPPTTVVADLDTQQIEVVPAADPDTDGPDEHVPDADAPDGDAPDGEAAPTTIDADLVTEPVDVHSTPPPKPTAIDAELDTEPIDQLPPPGATPVASDESVAPVASWVDTSPTTPFIITTASDAVPSATSPTTDEMPAIFDGRDEFVEYPTPREPFRLRVILVLSIFGAVAMLMSIAADIIDIRTTRPTSGISTGIQTLDDLGTNLGLAGFIGVAVMVIGALLACFGLRWGAGLAGGAGLALVGWSGLVVGLAELPIAIAESITRTSPEEFTLRVTRDLGWWLVAGVGVVGLIVFFASLRSIGAGGRRALNPIVAALTAVAAVVLAAGPLVPVGTAVLADNFRSTDPERDLPTAFFAGRLGQVALIALAAVVGMLIVRSFGLGLAAGGVSVAGWLWFSSFVELGNEPIGIAVQNPGSTSTVPHAVTTVGMVATLVLLIVAAAFAIHRLTRQR